MLALLLALGTWQTNRLAWKTGLLAEIAAAEAGPPLPLSADPAPFSKVAATGRFLHEREGVLGVELRGQTLGARLVTPFRAEGLPPVLVDRGWVPLERAAASIARPEGTVRLVGFVSPPAARSLFAAADDAAGRRFYTADGAAIGAALGLPDASPHLIVALAEEGRPAGALPMPATRLPRPNNPHLGYAITWYGLALALLGVVVAWARSRPAEEGA